ncbi:hypothetical protein BH09BAC6_BH09BAC6_15560 [soil metagenome]|jgi:hypothetical protein
MRSLSRYFCRYCIAICCCLAFSQAVKAQTDADALMIPKNFYCAGIMYANNSWDHYWEGTFKRDNANIGTVTTNAYTFVGNYGITNKLDVLFSVPYITTKASAGTLHSQKGLQDLTFTLKYLALQEQIGKGILSLHAIASGSIPLSNYEPDFLPLSIGAHSKSVMLRALVNYQQGRFFIAGAGQYINRNNITIDRNSYYTTQLYYSNQVSMPNATNFLVSTGYRSLKFNAEAILSSTTTRGGFDIRKNDMPFPSNRMNLTTMGALFKYSFDALSGLELTGGGNYVLQGRNVGQSTTVWGGVLYIFDFSKKDVKKNSK